MHSYIIKTRPAPHDDVAIARDDGWGIPNDPANSMAQLFAYEWENGAVVTDAMGAAIVFSPDALAALKLQRVTVQPMGV